MSAVTLPKDVNPIFIVSVVIPERNYRFRLASVGGTVVGPHLFNRYVDVRTYLEMFDNVIFPAGAVNYRLYRNAFEGIWWMQDGAPAHRSRQVTRRLAEIFGDLSLIHSVEWPPRCPYLTPCDFFL